MFKVWQWHVYFGCNQQLSWLKEVPREHLPLLQPTIAGAGAGTKGVSLGLPL